MKEVSDRVLVLGWVRWMLLKYTYIVLNIHSYVEFWVLLCHFHTDLYFDGQDLTKTTSSQACLFSTGYFDKSLMCYCIDNETNMPVSLFTKITK